MLQISQNIKQARVTAKKTQEEIATHLGIKRSTYANWEADTEPSFSDIKRIAEYLGVNVLNLVGEDVLVQDATKISFATIQKVDAKCTVILSALAEVLAHQRGTLVPPLAADLESMVVGLLKNKKQE